MYRSIERYTGFGAMDRFIDSIQDKKCVSTIFFKFKYKIIFIIK